MLRLVGLLLLAGALAAAVLVVPLRGRTVADRWRAAPGGAAFLSSAWDELRGAGPGSRRAAKGASGSGAAQGGDRGAHARRPAPGPPTRAPAEHLTPADREALDRLLAERAR